MIWALGIFTICLSAVASVVPEALIDSYYAYDFNAPHSKNRAYTTQPLRHNEPNINLIYGGLRFEGEKFRGRFVAQGGNSVEANTKDFETGDLRYVQESYLGVKLAERIWLDGGIYFSHIGAESWISKDNWTYSRALNLDYVPYYSAGIRLIVDKFHIHVMNGWQTIRETNEAKAVGSQYSWDLSEKFTLTYNTFFGDEEVVSDRPRFRGYHNFILRLMKDETWQYLAAVDFGHQAQQENDGVDEWGAATLTVRRVLDEKKSLALRLEHYFDPHEANVLTGTSHGFQVSGVSVNFDQYLAETLLWRTELRGFSSPDDLWPAGKNGLKDSDGFVVTSLSLWLK